MSMLNNQQGEQPAAQQYAPAQPAAPAQPVQGVPQAGAPAQSAYQGVAPGYAPVPQGPVVQKANRLSIILGIFGIVGAVGKPKTLKLNWLGILLNASPYVIFTVLMFLLPVLLGR